MTPQTEAGRRLWDFAHGLTGLDGSEQRTKATDLIHQDILTIEREAAQAAVERVADQWDDLLVLHVDGELSDVGLIQRMNAILDDAEVDGE